MQRTLQPWEISFQNRTTVYKLPIGTIPSRKNNNDNNNRAAEEPLFAAPCDTSPPPSPRDSEQTARYLAQRYYDIAVAHNDREFDVAAPPWSRTSANLRIEIAFGGAARKVGLREYLEIGRGMFGGDGELGVEVRDLTVQMVSLHVCPFCVGGHPFVCVGIGC